MAYKKHANKVEMIAKKGQHKGNAPSLHLTFFPHYSLPSAYFLKHNHMAEGYQIPSTCHHVFIIKPCF